MMDDEHLSLKSDRKLSFSTILKRCAPYLKKEWGYFVIAILSMALSTAAMTLLPLLESKITGLLSDVMNATLSSILGLAVGFVCLALGSNIIQYFNSIILSKAGERIVYRLRLEIYDHIESMSQNQLSQMPVGSLVTRVANYTTSVSDLFVTTLVRLFVNLLTVIGVYIVMFIVSWRLALLMGVIMIILGVTSFFFNRYVSGVFRKERGLTSDFNSYLNESLNGMKIIQIYNKQKKKNEGFIEKADAIKKTKFQVVTAFTFYRPFVSFLYYIGIAMTFYMGPILSLTGAEVLAFYLYLSNFFNPVQEIADQLNNIQKGSTGLERIFNLLDVKAEVVDEEGAIEVEHVEGKIEFRNVWFAYSDENWILKDISFLIPAKSTAAFVGATGAGKTTILALLARNYEPQKGEILIDDIPINHIKIQSLRRLLGQMLQDVFLFSGTIKDNITLYDDSFSQEEVKEASEYVQANHFIAKLENGYDSELSERGENLSQGERQLLSFARTILHKPQILILDEATANIDTETESLIQASLEKMKSIGTMLVVAHRLSTIQKSNQIIVLHKGEVVEKGNHQELLKNRGRYYKLYQLQFEESKAK